MATTIKLRRSPRNHRSTGAALDKDSLFKGNEPQTVGSLVAKNKPTNIGSATVLHPTSGATVASNVAVKPSEKSEEDDCPSGSHQALTENALKELGRQLNLIDPNTCNSELGAGRFGALSEDGSSQGGGINSQERFNRKWGYVPPLDEKTTRIIEAIIRDPALAKTMIGIGPENPQFLSGLHNRNVLSDPSAQIDPRAEEIRSLSLKGCLQATEEEDVIQEELWRLDKAKCTPDSSEALFQRTLMISLIARHHFIYQLDSSKPRIFDFSVDEPWGCLPMPSRLLWAVNKGVDSEARFLTQPKPDLAICFKREAVISDRLWKALPEPIKGLACFENCSSSASRVFHFLAVEAKKAMFDLDSPQALHQCLNDASQALHNMFEFFRDAGPEHERRFYEKIRFFSIVTNRKGIIVRVHRAIRKPNDASTWELVMPDQPRYRLEFEFREFYRIDDANKFSRNRVLEVIKKILKYAMDDLSEMINAAASKLVQNLEKNLGLYHARRAVDFYSYGQPNPKSLKSSKITSVDPSTMDTRLQRRFQSASLGLQCRPSDQSTVNGHTIPKEPHPPLTSSRLASSANKRKLDVLGMDNSEELSASDSHVRKRRRPSQSIRKSVLPSPPTASLTTNSQ